MSTERRVARDPIPPGRPRCPVSSRGLLVLVDEPLEGAVSGRVVGGVVLPAVPDHVEPGSGQDAGRVGVVVTVAAGSVVELGGPGVGVAGVAAKSVTASRSCLSQAQRKWTVRVLPDCRVVGATPARQARDSGVGNRPRQSPISASSRAARMVPERGRLVKMWASACRASCSLIWADKALIWSTSVVSTASRARVVWASAVAWSPVAPRGAATNRACSTAGSTRTGVANAAQPRRQPPRAEPVGPVLGLEPGQERQADRGVEVGEQADGAGEDVEQVGAELVGEGDPVGDEVLAGPAGATQGEGGVAVGGQRNEPGPVGAEGVGEDERVESVILAARGAVAAAQILQLVRRDHHHGDPGLEQAIDDRAVGSLDRHFRHAAPLEDGEQVAQPGGGMFHGGPVKLAAAVVHDRHGMIIAGPVDTGGQVVGRLVGQSVAGRLHVSLLAASSSGEAPVAGSRTRLPVRSLIGAQRRTALSTVGASWETAGSRRSWSGRVHRQARMAVTRQHPRCISHPSKIADRRHAAPVSEAPPSAATSVVFGWRARGGRRDPKVPSGREVQKQQ